MKLRILATLALVFAGSTATANGWVFYEKTDPFTDENISYAIFSIDVPKGEHYPNAIVAQCNANSSNGFDIRIEAAKYISNEPAPVRWRFDKGEAYSGNWETVEHGEAVIAKEAGFADEFRRTELNELVFEIVNFKDRARISIFEGLAQGRENLDYVLDGCKGTLPSKE